MQEFSLYTGFFLGNILIKLMISRTDSRNHLTSVVQSIHNHIKLFKKVHTILWAVQIQKKVIKNNYYLAVQRQQTNSPYKSHTIFSY